MKFLFLVLFAVTLAAQTETPKASMGRVIGVVTAKDPSGKQLTVKSDAGPDYTVTVDEKTLFLRVPPGEKDLKKGAKIGADEVKVGDRVMARGTVSEEQKTVPAVSVIVMTKEDLAQKQQREQAEWQTRGVLGTVKSIAPASNEVVIASPAREGVVALTAIVTGPKTNIRRYAPDSVQFSDAKPAQLGDIQAGDHLRALGQNNPEGTRLEAESLVFGTFRTIGGTVIAVDAAKNEIRLKDLETKQPITIKVNADAQMRKLPPMMANMLARRLNPSYQAVAGAAGGANGGGTGFRPGQSAGPGGAPPSGSAGAGVRDASQRGGPGGAGGAPGGSGAARGGGNVEQMMERMPLLTLVELQPGDPLIVTTTARAGVSVANAITVLSGVEPILRAAPAAGVNLGGWSLEMNMPAQ
jgi:hypothetical protein